MRLKHFLVLAALAACSHNRPTETTDSPHLALGMLQSGSAEGVTVELIRVDDESRCPSNVQCIWSGNAKVVITVRTPGMPIGVLLAQQFVNTNVEPRSVDVNNFRVRLDSLKPYPVAGQAIEQKDYVAYLTVTKTD